MGLILRYSLVISLVLLINPYYCISHKLFNVSQIQNHYAWNNAVATWYGPPDGAGSDGGACGYVDSVEKPPLSKMISAGGPSIYLQGKGCGACYEVKCTGNAACSGKPVHVMISDECPGCESFQFDLSGTAFGSMAKPGQDYSLRNAGRIGIQYRRIPCNFGRYIAFIIDGGSNPYYFAVEIEYENGSSDISQVQLKQANSNTWIPMNRLWGARFALNFGSILQAPFSIKIIESDRTIVANNVIPQNWQPGQVYRSSVNF